jgi:hypothetical protein
MSRVSGRNKFSNRIKSFFEDNEKKGKVKVAGEFQLVLSKHVSDIFMHWHVTPVVFPSSLTFC